jgi:hypothetical protein
MRPTASLLFLLAHNEATTSVTYYMRTKSFYISYKAEEKRILSDQSRAMLITLERALPG